LFRENSAVAFRTASTASLPYMASPPYACVSRVSDVAGQR